MCRVYAGEGRAESMCHIVQVLYDCMYCVWWAHRVLTDSCILPELDVQQWRLKEHILTLHVHHLLHLSSCCNGGLDWLGLDTQVCGASRTTLGPLRATGSLYTHIGFCL